MKKPTPGQRTMQLAKVILYVIATTMILGGVAPTLASSKSNEAVALGFALVIFWLLATAWIAFNLLAQKRQKTKATTRGKTA